MFVPAGWSGNNYFRDTKEPSPCAFLLTGPVFIDRILLAGVRDHPPEASRPERAANETKKLGRVIIMKRENGLRAATWSGEKVLFITQAGIIAAIYVVLTVVFAPFGFGEVQVRVSEMLTILPFFMPSAIPGLFVGCLIGNTLGGAVVPDIIFGSLATLVGAVVTHYIGKNYPDISTKNLILAALPPIIANAIVVPFVLKYAYAVPLPIPLMMLTVGIGEVVSCGVFGVMLGRAMGRFTLQNR